MEDISLEVFPGEILVILGESGCGKSTLMKQMIGIYQPFSGQVLINGMNINTEDETERWRNYAGKSAWPFRPGPCSAP